MKWEYLKLSLLPGDVQQGEVDNERLRKLGEEGWELVGTSYQFLFFKRSVGSWTVHWYDEMWWNAEGRRWDARERATVFRGEAGLRETSTIVEAHLRGGIICQLRRMPDA